MENQINKDKLDALLKGQRSKAVALGNKVETPSEVIEEKKPSYIKQGLAGFLETPGAIAALPGYIGALSGAVVGENIEPTGLVSDQSFGKRFGQYINPERNPALALTKANTEGVNRLLGIEEPTTFGGQLARLAGGLAVPLPVAAIRAGSNTSKILETFTPFITNPTKGKVAGTLAVGTAVDQGTRVATGQENNVTKGYRKWLSEHPLVKDASIVAGTVLGAVAGKKMISAKSGKDAITENTPFGKVTPPTSEAKIPISQKIIQAQLDDAQAARYIAKETDNPNLLADIDLRGSGDLAAVSTTIDTGKFAGSTIKTHSPVQWELEFKALPQEEQLVLQRGMAAMKEKSVRVDALRHSLLQKVQGKRLATANAAKESGKANPAIKSQQVTLDALRNFNERQLRSIATRLDVDLTEVNPRVGLRSLDNPEQLASSKDIESYITSLQKNPKLLQMADKVWDQGDKALQYAKEMGILSREEADSFRKTFGRQWVPSYEAIEKQKGFIDSFQRLVGWKENERASFDTIREFLQASRVSGEGVKAPIASQYAMAQYMTNLQLLARRNRRQVGVLDALSSSADLKGLATKLDKMPKRLTNSIIHVKRNGESEYWDVSDSALRDALEFSPQVTDGFLGVLNRLRQFKQQGITGVLNPAFAPIAAAYDVSSGTLIRPSGTTLGYIDEALQRVSNQRLGMRGDPTAFLAAIEGATRYTYGKSMNVLSKSLYADLAQNGFFSKVSPDVVKKLADTAQDAYLRSSVQVAEEYGALSRSFQLDDDLPQVSSILRDAAAHYGTNLSGFANFGRMFKYLYEGVHNSARMAHFAQTRRVRSALNKPDNIEQTAAATRKLSGDFSRRGDSATAKFLSANVLYYHPAIQAMRQFSSMTMKNPTKVSAAVLSTAGISAIAEPAMFDQLGEEWSNWYWGSLSEHVRSSNIIIPLPWLSPEKSLIIPLAPELTPFKAMASSFIDATFGYSNGLVDEQVRNDPIRRSLLTSVNRWFPITTPPAVEAIGAATGHKVQFGLKDASLVPLSIYELTDSSITPRGMKLDPVKGLNDSVINEDMDVKTSAIIEAMFGTVARTLMDSTTAFDQAQHQGIGLGKALKESTKPFEQQQKAQLRILNPLWGQSGKPSSWNAQNDLTWKKGDKFDHIIELYNRGFVSVGQTRIRNGKPLGYLQATPNEDLVERVGQFLKTEQPATGKSYQNMINKINEGLSDLRHDKIIIKSDPSIRFDDKMTRLDKNALEYNELMSHKLDVLQRIEKQIQTGLGIENFTFEDVELEDYEPK